MIQLAVSSFVITFCYAIIFQIRGKNIFYASLGASLGSIVYDACMTAGLHYFLALLYTSIVISCYSEMMSRKRKAPVTLFLISAIICFVPGGLMYHTMAEIIQGNMEKSVSLGMEALASAGALALGIMITSSLFKVYIFVKRTWRSAV